MHRRSRTSSFVAILLLALFFPACGEDNPAGPVSTGNGQPPKITMVTWTQDPGCTPSTSSGVTVVITATDADTDAGSLGYSGSVSSCGLITGQSTVVTCPQVALYRGTATVRDPEGNSDTVSFSFGPCQDGQFTP
ncbi:MAG: hypothetical protein ACE5EO_06510 [Candidatus Krumholzibacteriia bacterium]